MLDEDAKEEVLHALWRFINSAVDCADVCQKEMLRHGWKGEPLFDFLNEHFPDSYVEQVLGRPIYTLIDGEEI